MERCKAVIGEYLTEGLRQRSAEQYGRLRLSDIGTVIGGAAASNTRLCQN